MERHLNPMTTNLAVADPERSDKTICLAISPSMKALGIKNRCRVFQIPTGVKYIMASPRMKFYIEYCLDNDVPRRKASETLMQKYYELGYEVEDCPPPEGSKDYNEWLVGVKKEHLDQVKAKEILH